MTANERIRFLRSDILKLSQQEFSSKLNMSRSNLGNIENGIINLTDRVITDICREYSVREEWLLNGESPIFIEGNDLFISQISEIYEKLNEDNKKYLKGYIQALIDKQSADTNKQE